MFLETIPSHVSSGPSIRWMHPSDAGLFVPSCMWGAARTQGHVRCEDSQPSCMWSPWLGALSAEGASSHSSLLFSDAGGAQNRAFLALAIRQGGIWCMIPPSPPARQMWHGRGLDLCGLNIWSRCYFTYTCRVSLKYHPTCLLLDSSDMAKYSVESVRTMKTRCLFSFSQFCIFSCHSFTTKRKDIFQIIFH